MGVRELGPRMNADERGSKEKNDIGCAGPCPGCTHTEVAKNSVSNSAPVVLAKIPPLPPFTKGGIGDGGIFIRTDLPTIRKKFVNGDDERVFLLFLICVHLR